MPKGVYKRTAKAIQNISKASKNSSQKRVKTIREKYDIWPTQREDVIEKIRQGNIETFKNPKIRKQRSLRMRGDKNPSRMYEISEETRRKKSESMKILWATKEFRKKMQPHLDKFKIKTKKHKKNLAIAARKRVQNNLLNNIQNFCPNLGKHETQLLNEQEKKDKCTILRQYYIIGFKVDGYCKETNTVYEVYEKGHFSKQKIKQDLKRQKEIENELNCKFVIIKDH